MILECVNSLLIVLEVGGFLTCSFEFSGYSTFLHMIGINLLIYDDFYLLLCFCSDFLNIFPRVQDDFSLPPN